MKRIPVNLDNPDRGGVERCEDRGRRHVPFLAAFESFEHGRESPEMDRSAPCTRCLDAASHVRLGRQGHR